MIKLRKAEEEDLDKLAEIYTISYNSLNIGENWDDESAKKLLHHLLGDQEDLFFVIEENGEVAGAIVGLIKPWWDGNHITDGELFVHPNHQGRGFGKKLIKKLFTEAQNKYQAVSWDTFTHVVHEHPMKWYKDMGFEKIDEWAMITGDIKKVLENLK